MLKILIIDNDIIVRKGMRTIIPWEQYNMTIVGEASNGEAALDFLHSHSVDIAFVDLDMPIMDGITFIRTATPIYPDLHFVILTVHTEFEQIQTALRLGVIDYIAKNQIEKDNFDLILQRISNACNKKTVPLENNKKNTWFQTLIPSSYVYVLITMKPDFDQHIFSFFTQNSITEYQEFHELMVGVWCFTNPSTTFIFPDSFPHTMLLCITDVKNMSYSQLRNLLRTYIKNELFYDFKDDLLIHYKQVHDLEIDSYCENERTFEQLKEKWCSLNWVHENDLFRQFKCDLKNSRLKFSQLYHFLLTLENIWNTTYRNMTNHVLSLPSDLYSWDDVEKWLIDTYEMTNLFVSSEKYSNEIVKSIVGVKTDIALYYNKEIDAAEIARNVHMSYGYFNRCFYDIIGCTFHDYFTRIRLQHAQKILTSSNKSIQQIAIDVGYHDEKYFSRLFKKKFGVSPSEYRRIERFYPSNPLDE